MKIMIIGSRQMNAKNDSTVIAQRLRADGVEAELIYWEDIVVTVNSGSVFIRVDGRDILQTPPTLVIALGWYKNGAQAIYRDLAFAVALCLKARNIRFWNSEMAEQRSTTKLSCMVQLALAGVPVPRTHYALTTQNITSLESVPYVMKAAAASRGRDNYLIRTEEDLTTPFASGVSFVVQPYLPNDHDLRIICFDGRPALILKRMRGRDAATHLNNTSQGGEAQWLALTDVAEGLLTLSEKICRITGREMAGIDFIPDESSEYGYSCLEVNAVPQLTSGIDAEKKMTALAAAIQHINDVRN